MKERTESYKIGEEGHEGRQRMKQEQLSLFLGCPKMHWFGVCMILHRSCRLSYHVFLYV